MHLRKLLNDGIQPNNAFIIKEEIENKRIKRLTVALSKTMLIIEI
jgi:uncharacterized protein YpmB